jgi:hypothetical protein
VSADLALCPRGLSEDKMPRRKQARHTKVKDIRSILRLTFEQGLSTRAVSERLKISKTSISTYLLRAREAGLAAWPLPADLDEDNVLEQRLFRRMGRPPRDTDYVRIPRLFEDLALPGWTGAFRASSTSLHGFICWCSMTGEPIP